MRDVARETGGDVARTFLLLVVLGALLELSAPREREQHLQLYPLVAEPSTHDAPPTPSPAPTIAPPASPGPQAAARAPAGTIPKRASSATGGSGLLMSWFATGPHGPNCAGASRYPMHSWLRLRNPGNGRVLGVQITDRGDFERLGRSVDCDPFVWSSLGFDLGHGVVRVEVV